MNLVLALVRGGEVLHVRAQRALGAHDAACGRDGGAAADQNPGDQQHQHRDQAGADGDAGRALRLDQVGAREAADPLIHEALDLRAGAGEAHPAVTHRGAALHGGARLVDVAGEGAREAVDADEILSGGRVSRKRRSASRKRASFCATWAW